MSGLRNIVTFGASGRIENKISEFEDLRSEYESLYAEMEEKREEVNDVLEKVIQVKVTAINELKKISRISEQLKGKDREILHNTFGNEFADVSFAKIDATISAGQMAMNAAKGVSAGVSTALGAWALVSTFGTASTGTAIAGLSGVAATNATLAWFGGGALTVGGGGIAAGTAAIGGIVAIPALVLTGVFAHMKANKQIQEIEQQMLQVIQTIDQLHSNILKLDLMKSRSEELNVSIDKATHVFNQEFAKVYMQIYPLGILSKFVKHFRKKVLRRNFFSAKDVQQIGYIGQIATDYAALIDTKVIE